MVEKPLEGGIANAGSIVRDGAHVLRPASPHAESIHAWLQAVRSTGFVGVPAPIRVDPDGRQRLEFVEGDVPLPPYPAWARSDHALASVARLLRRLHDASEGFDATGHTWSDRLADPRGGPIVGHNDVELSNVVFRAGVAVAFIDLDFAAPGRPVYDLAQLCRMCVPIDAAEDRARLGWERVDPVGRVLLVADAYGLDDAGREALPAAVDDALDQIDAAVRVAVAEGHQPTIDLWDQTGGEARLDRRRRWWLDHRESIAAQVRPSSRAGSAIRHRRG